MKKKALFSLFTAAVCAVSGFAAIGCGNESDHEFTILAVKETTTNDYNDMQVFKDLNEETGIDVSWKFNTSAQYSKNTDPVGTRGVDAIYHCGFSNLDLVKYGERGRIVAIDKYLDRMPNFKKILDSRADIKQALLAPDGHIYSLPRVEEIGLKQYPNILFINKVWIKKLMDTGKMPASCSEITEADLVDGLDLSRAQYKDLLIAFNANDMDPAIEDKNEVPLAFVNDNWQGNISDLIASFGVPENTEHKTIVDGNVIFTVEDEKWYDAIKELNDWYKKSLIRTASFDSKQDSFLAKGQDGRYGSFYWWEKETVVNSSKHDDYIIVKPLKDDNGNRYVGISNTLEVEKAVCVILGSCKNPGKLLEYFDKFFEPDYSAQLNYGSISAGAFKAEKENGKLIPNTDHGKQSADDFRMRNAPYGVVYLTAETWENSVEMEPRAKLRLQRLADYVIPYTYPGATQIPNLNYNRKELNDLYEAESHLGKSITSWMTKGITGDSAPTKAEWEKFIGSNSSAINQIKKINQAAYDRYLAEINK